MGMELRDQERLERIEKTKAGLEKVDSVIEVKTVAVRVQVPYDCYKAQWTQSKPSPTEVTV